MTKSRVVVGLYAFLVAAGLSGLATAQVETAENEGPEPVLGKLKVKETENLRLVVIPGGQEYLMPHVAACFENSMQFHRELWSYTPSERATVLLTDFSDRGNASALSVPRNFLMLQSAPLGFDYETVAANERMNWLMNHELVHICAVDNAAHSDRFFRSFFQGKVMPEAENPESILYFYLTVPRDAAPRWYHEGIAVFIETWMAGGRGRALGVWDEMVFRSMIRDESRFYDPLGLVSEGTKIDFQVEVNSYLYGTRFMSYLAQRYSPESLVEWVARTKGSRKYYASQFKQVYGRPLKDVWADWIEWEHEFQQANLERIRQYPVTEHEDLTEQPLGSVSRAHYDATSGEIYAGFNYPGMVAHMGKISLADGTVERIVDIKGPAIFAVTSVAYDRESRTIFYTSDNLEHRDVHALDPDTGEDTTLLEDVRIGDLAFDPADRSLWGVRHFNGLVTLVRIPHPYDRWNQVHTWPYGDVMYGLDVSPDGRYLSASVGEVDGRHSLRVWETDALLAGETEPIAELDFGNTIPSDFRFSPGGDYLYGSSYYSGVSNIFRYDFRSAKFEAISNTETGYFRPIPLEDGTLIVFRYTGDGFVPARIAAEPLENVTSIKLLGNDLVQQHPQLKGWVAGSPGDIPIDTMITREGAYHGFKKIGLESIYPVVEGYKEYGAIGLRTNFSDPLLLNRLNITASYTPDHELPSDERLHLHLDFKRYNWWVNAALNRADFYDLFGPTETSRKGQHYSGGWDKVLLYDKPRRLELNLAAAHSRDIDTLPLYQNVPSPVDQVSSVYARLGYTNVRSSLGHVDDEKGYNWEIINLNEFVESETIPSLVGKLDKGFALPLRHSSIWLRGAAGFAIGDLENAFANFYFGGFGNNYVDHREVKRYREFYAFPGVEINEISGRNFGKLMLEWDPPPLRFRRVGSPGFYLSWMRPAIFVSALATNLDLSDQRTELANAGVQLDFQFTALSRLPMIVSVGYAAAFEHGQRSRNEAMVSLSIMPGTSD